MSVARFRPQLSRQTPCCRRHVRPETAMPALALGLLRAEAICTRADMTPPAPGTPTYLGQGLKKGVESAMGMV